MGRLNFGVPPTPPIQTSEPLAIHDIYILDSSGSMQGEKYNNAIEGIRQCISDNMNDVNAKFLTTFIEFSNSDSIIIHCKDAEASVALSKCNRKLIGNMTALYDAIGTALTMDFKGSVLVKIFTDGDENASAEYNVHTCSALIQKRIADKWTITFVGTAEDTKKVQNNLGILKDNTLVHNNTGAGVKQAFETTRGATQSYTSNLSKGLDVVDGFYKSMD